MGFSMLVLRSSCRSSESKPLFTTFGMNCVLIYESVNRSGGRWLRQPALALGPLTTNS